MNEENSSVEIHFCGLCNLVALRVHNKSNHTVSVFLALLSTMSEASAMLLHLM